jgi:RNA polymerase subunit RPABC4/transcription elongation factor Spt4
MGVSRSRAQRLLRRARRDVAAHWQGALVITALAASDVAYRLLMREPLRRALGIETTHA